MFGGLSHDVSMVGAFLEGRFSEGGRLEARFSQGGFLEARR
jgi:hypothetical protein